MLRRFWSTFLLLTWCALGTGLLAHLHNVQHEQEDRREVRLGHHGPVQHDERNCDLHAQLCAPVMSQTTIIVVPTAGVLLETLQPVDQTVHVDPIRLLHACRGPPTFAAC